MSLQKVIVPPAISLGLLFAVIYGLGSCMSAIPEQYRPKGLEDNGLLPEERITITAPDGGSPMTISLFSWGARFSEHDGALGTLRYERVYYTLKDRRGGLVWKMISHDTYISVADPTDSKVLTIVRRKDRIDFIGREGEILPYITLDDETASLLSADGALLARARRIGSGAELIDPEGRTLLVSDLPISPAGLCCSALPRFDPVERAALMVMVK